MKFQPMLSLRTKSRSLAMQQQRPVSVSVAHISTKGCLCFELLPEDSLMSKGFAGVALPLTDFSTQASGPFVSPEQHSRSDAGGRGVGELDPGHEHEESGCSTCLP